MRIKQSVGFFAALTMGVLACTDAHTPTSLDGPAFRNERGQPVDVCHRDADLAAWKLLAVAAAALPAHVRHGDAQPGDYVPGMAGFVFDETCTPVETEPVVWAIAYTDVIPGDGPGFKEGIDKLIAKFIDASGEGVPGAGDEIITDQYPKGFSFDVVGFAQFRVKSHTASAVSIPNSFTIEATLVNGDTFNWRRGNNGEGYVESATGGVTRITDGFSNNGDNLAVRTGSPSRPAIPILVGLVAIGDHAHVDVEVNLPPS